MTHYLKRLRWYLQGGPLFVVLSTAGRFQAARRVALRIYRYWNPVRIGKQTTAVSLLAFLDPAEAARTLERDGICPGLRLEEKAQAELLESFLEMPCYGEGRLEFPFYYSERKQAERRYGRSFLLGHYYRFAKPGDAADRLARDPLLLQIARGYFGTEPVFVGMRAWWSFAGPASRSAQLAAGQGFHYDLDDYRSMSVFLYLTDVDDSSGPHICFRGSHRSKKLSHVLSPLRRRSDEELLRTYGSDAMIRLCGPAGVGFAEDTFCFHKGLHPETNDRLTLQLRFAIRDYGRASDYANANWSAAVPLAHPPAWQRHLNRQ